MPDKDDEKKRHIEPEKKRIPPDDEDIIITPIEEDKGIWGTEPPPKEP